MLSTHVVLPHLRWTLTCLQLARLVFCIVEATRVTLVAMPKLRRMSDTPLAGRPREKLQRQGAAALSDFGLFELLVGAGVNNVSLGQLARSLQRLLYKHGAGVTLEQLSEIRGKHCYSQSRARHIGTRPAASPQQSHARTIRRPALLTHRVQALSPTPFQQQFLEIYNEDDSFFLLDALFGFRSIRTKIEHGISGSLLQNAPYKNTTVITAVVFL